MTAPSVAVPTVACTFTGCTAALPTRPSYEPLPGGRYVLRHRLDLDAWRTHLLTEHVRVRPALRGVA